ncbi:Acg family FMN-binding oxidoreductase [Streptomyces sp. NPDC001828]|uniref:Acg family FMN-binding oxidoreductase n=1 Tax=Streptomyces sp. NPDC001828 TaxID=3364615 RepID=UPI0036877594
MPRTIPILDVPAVTALIEAATAAPSLHNAQPWRFRYLRATNTVELYSDERRAVSYADPRGRALHIGCGASLFTLRVACAGAGLDPEVSPLPDPARPELLAAVRLNAQAPRDTQGARDLASLRQDIARRHTSRYPFAPTLVPEPVRDALRDAAACEGAELLFPHPWHVDALLDLAQDAESQNAHDPEQIAELARWTRVGATPSDTAVDGVPDFAFAPRRRSGAAPIRDFATGRPVADRGRLDFERVPQLALLGTAEDSPGDWLRAGQALQHVLLLAKHHDLVANVTTEALEREDLRWAVRDPLSAMPYVQVMLRIGYGPAGPRSPRRTVRDVLTIE